MLVRALSTFLTVFMSLHGNSAGQGGYNWSKSGILIGAQFAYI